jgi:ketosteroid isomerase-like protein
MFKDNAAVVRRVFEDTNARNFEAAIDAHADDVVVSFHGEFHAFFGELAGKAAVKEWMADWLQAFGSDYEFEIAELRELGDRVLVVVTHHGVGRSGGVPITQQQAWIYTVRDDVIVRNDVYPNRAAALQALGVA